MLNLPFKPGIRRADRDNTIDVYIGDEYMDVLADGAWERFFTEKPEGLYPGGAPGLAGRLTGVGPGHADAFFPFGDNIERAHKSGVTVIAQPGGSIRDDHVIRHLRQVQHRHGLYGHPPVPPLMAGGRRSGRAVFWDWATVFAPRGLPGASACIWPWAPGPPAWR